MRTCAPALLVAGGVVVAVAAAGAFQTGQQAPPIFRSGIDVVQLDVSVLDKQRRPVRGLTSEDFTVVEDGKPQRIVAVSEVTMERGDAMWPVWARAAAPDVASTDVGDKRILAIVIDGGGFNVSQILQGVMERLVPGDVVAVIGGGCEVPFTEDLERLRVCLSSVVAGSSRQRLPAPAPAPTRRNDVQHHILRDVVEYLAAVPQRRKAIIYIGNGFSPGSPGPSSRGGRPQGPDQRAQRSQDDYRETLWFAHRANVNIYTMSSGFNRISRGGVSSRPSDSLKTLAQETGGLYLGGTNTVAADLDQLFLENGTYYLVGYQTSNPEMDGKYRKLSVKVNVPDAMVRTRTLAFRPKSVSETHTSAAAVPSQGLTGRLRDWMPSIDVAFDAIAMPFAQTGKPEAAVAIVTGLSEPVQYGTTRVVQRMDVRTLIYDDRGTLVTDLTKRVELDAVPSTDNRVRYDVVQQVPLVPGRYSFRLVAHNADTDKVGAIEFSLVVPDFSRDYISMYGVAISSALTEPMMRVGTLGSIVPVMPTAIRKFLPDDRVTAFVRVHQGGAEPTMPATLDVKILNAMGTPVFSRTEPLTAERFGAERVVDLKMDLPLTGFRAGQYLLTLQATRGTRKTLPRDIRFTVR
jgi:VWFA-related protein